MTDSLPFLTDGAAPANPAAPGPRRCYRHQWAPVIRTANGLISWSSTFVLSGDEVVEACRRCNRVKADAATVSRVRRASARGFRTSADLAAYLGGQNVDKLGWPWDVQGRGYRIQSKRDQVTRGPIAYARLIDAIPAEGDYLRAVYHVPPRKRLEAGVLIVRASEWAQWHGTTDGLHLLARSPIGDLALLEMPLPTFRDLHIGSAA